MSKHMQKNERCDDDLSQSIAPAKPSGYETYLSHFKPCLFDSTCGEPIAWGFEIIQHLGEDRFNALSAFGTLVFRQA